MAVGSFCSYIRVTWWIPLSSSFSIQQDRLFDYGLTGAGGILRVTVGSADDGAGWVIPLSAWLTTGCCAAGDHASLVTESSDSMYKDWTPWAAKYLPRISDIRIIRIAYRRRVNSELRMPNANYNERNKYAAQWFREILFDRALGYSKYIAWVG